MGPNGVAGPSDEGTRRSTRGALLVRLVDFEFPVLYIQSGALQGVTVHLGPAEFVHLKKIRGTPEASGSSLLGTTRLGTRQSLARHEVLLEPLPHQAVQIERGRSYEAPVVCDLAPELTGRFARNVGYAFRPHLGRKTMLFRQLSVCRYPFVPICLKVGTNVALANHALEDLVGVGSGASLSQRVGIVQVQRDDHPLHR